jgi:hypothetical protein
MRQLRWWLTAAALIVCDPTQTARGSVRPPTEYILLFDCDKLDSARHQHILYNLSQKLADSLGTVPLRALPMLTDVDRRSVTQHGGEVLDVRLDQSGDNWNVRLEVDSRLHPAKPYAVMTSKTKISASDIVSIAGTRDRIIRKIQEHHMSCHIQGACP